MTNAAGAWFVHQPAPVDARVTLFCLPHSGAGASAYRHWRTTFPDWVSVQPIQLPGRESRIAEPPEFTPEEVADAMLTRIDRPYAVYGHSMGALLAGEAVRELVRRGEQPPLQLYVSASTPPGGDVSYPAGILELGDRSIVEELVNLGGTVPDLLEHEQMLAIAVRLIRADFGWVTRYPFADTRPLPIPITALAGDRDPIADVDLVAGWKAHTDVGFRFEVLPGGHFFVHERLTQVVEMISDELSAALE